MESQLSKDQAAGAYMNQIYLGVVLMVLLRHRKPILVSPGRAECSRMRHAGRPASEPGQREPDQNLDRALARQKVALWRMHDAGVIDDAQYRGRQGAEIGHPQAH